VRADQQGNIQQPLSGWFGHAAPFEFTPEYTPAIGISQMLVGSIDFFLGTIIE
jgi:kynureninase